jgi:hypothetical protein
LSTTDAPAIILDATEALPIITGDVGTITKTVEERSEALDRQLQVYGAQGWRIENRSTVQATIAKGKEVNNTLHFFITLFTLGLWGIIWIALLITGGVKRRLLTVDEFGNVVEQKL